MEIYSSKVLMRPLFLQMSWISGWSSERGGANYDRSVFDDFAIYDRALTESDLKKIASGTSAGSLDGLIAFWDFNTAPAAGGDGAISSVALADGSVVIGRRCYGMLKSATSVTGLYSAVVAQTRLSRWPL